MPTAQALGVAKRRGMDLVEVSPNANPPICKILDAGRYRYELAKKDRDSKKHSTVIKLKELKFHINIDPHDYATKMRHAEEFLWKGMKVKIALVFRGREMMHQNIGRQLVQKIIADLAQIATPDSMPKQMGKIIHLMLTPLPVAKRQRKWKAEDDTSADEPASDIHEDAAPEAPAAESGAGLASLGDAFEAGAKDPAPSAGSDSQGA